MNYHQLSVNFQCKWLRAMCRALGVLAPSALNIDQDGLPVAMPHSPEPLPTSLLPNVGFGYSIVWWSWSRPLAMRTRFPLFKTELSVWRYGCKYQTGLPAVLMHRSSSGNKESGTLLDTPLPVSFMSLSKEGRTTLYTLGNNMYAICLLHYDDFSGLIDDHMSMILSREM